MFPVHEIHEICEFPAFDFLLPSVRGDFLMKLGRTDEARAEFERAASLTQNAREHDLLLSRAGACGAR